MTLHGSRNDRAHLYHLVLEEGAYPAALLTFAVSREAARAQGRDYIRAAYDGNGDLPRIEKAHRVSFRTFAIDGRGTISGDPCAPGQEVP